MPTIEIFCCYAQEDQKLLHDLKMQLMPLQRNRHIHIWADTDINAGDEWKKEIDKHLNTAQIILLLISPNFIASDYCYSIEMKRALERHEQGEARVIPIILRPTDWRNTPPGKLHALPAGVKPVTLWDNQDDAFLNVAEGVRKTVAEMQSKTLPVKEQSQDLKKVEVSGMISEKNPNKMSNGIVKAVSIGIAVVIIATFIEGISLLYHTTLAGTAKPTPTSVATTAIKTTPTSSVTPTPSPSTPVLVRPKTLFLADLMSSYNNTDQWDQLTQSYVTCGFSNGGYDVKVPANTVGGCNTNASTTNLTDFIYEIDMTIVSGVTNDTSYTRGAGLMFRYSDQNGASNYGVSFQQDGTYYLFTYNNGTPGASLGTGHCPSFHQGTNQTNLIDVKMLGSTITLFVNDAYVTTVTDTQFKSGQLGVQIGSGSTPSEVIYRNLKVWKL